MSDDNGQWKGRYLSALDRHEAREAQWNARLDLLRRSLVRASMAAEGQDPAVDHCMRALRELLLQPDERLDAGLEQLVPRLEQALFVYDQRREKQAARTSAALHQLAGQLVQLPAMTRTTRRTLKRLAKRLDRRLARPEGLTGLLEELARLQGDILQSAPMPEPDRDSLWQRLFGGRQQPDGPAGQHPPPDQTAARPEPAAAAMLPPPTEPGPDSDFELPASPEPAYSVIADRVQAILLGLLADLQLPGPQQIQAELIRERVIRGLNWYELVPLLDDLAVMLRGLFGLDPQVVEAHFGQLQEHLASTREQVGGLGQAHQASCRLASAFDRSVLQYTSQLQQQLPGLSGPDGLQARLTEQARTLQQQAARYQRQRQGREALLATRLQQLQTRLASMEQDNTQLREKLAEQQQKALHDPLTGLPNRAALDARLAGEIHRCQQPAQPLALAVMDVDHFKQINDNYGHMAGDKVLRIMAGKWSHRLRKTDFMARYGGEEFVLLLPDTGPEAALEVVEDLRRCIGDCPFHFRGERIPITVSAGLASLETGDDAGRIFERADQALYRAKQTGRNRTEQG